MFPQPPLPFHHNVLASATAGSLAQGSKALKKQEEDERKDKVNKKTFLGVGIKEVDQLLSPAQSSFLS